MSPTMVFLDELEIGMCLRINGLGRHEAVRRFFALVSRLGDGAYWVAVGLGLLAVSGTSVLPQILQVILTSATGVLIYKLIKGKLVRERPYVTNGRIVCGAAPLDRYSFPSGHTLHAVSLTTMYASVEPSTLFLTLPFALLVATSRVVLGLHYPSDVLVGASLGGLLASLSLWLMP